MNTGGTQTVRATKGNEEKAKTLYRDLRDIIKANSAKGLNVTLKEIAGVEPSSWANYIKTGKVSEFVVQNLTSFSGLKREVFTCEMEFGENEKHIFKAKLRKKYGNNGILEKGMVGEEISAPNYINYSSVEYLTRQIAEQITNTEQFESVEEFDKLFVKLEKLVELAKTSKTLFEKKLEF